MLEARIVDALVWPMLVLICPVDEAVGPTFVAGMLVLICPVNEAVGPMFVAGMLVLICPVDAVVRTMFVAGTLEDAAAWSMLAPGVATSLPSLLNRLNIY